MNITKNVKTHYVLVKEWQRNDIKKIAITNAQYELYKEELWTKSYSSFFTIHDIDTQEILFEWRASKIDWFEVIKKDKELIHKFWRCSFWVKHPLSMHEWCECAKEYNTLWLLFVDKIKELWYDIKTNRDITDEMRLTYKQKYL